MIGTILLLLAQPGAAGASDPSSSFDCGEADSEDAQAACAAAEAAVDEAIASLDRTVPDDDCEDSRTPQQMYNCAVEVLAQAEAGLAEQWILTANVLMELDKPFDGEENLLAGYYESTEAAQRAWLPYRDAECVADSLPGIRSGRSVQVTLELQCKGYMTQQRIEYLRDLVAGLQ